MILAALRWYIFFEMTFSVFSTIMEFNEAMERNQPPPQEIYYVYVAKDDQNSWMPALCVLSLWSKSLISTWRYYT